jgi:16S rRNA (guanine527-N7)-methyltransferase
VGLLGAPAGSFLDLGSGAGLPGLVLALRWPQARGVLLDAGHRRGEHLEAACRELGLTDRVAVVVARAEEAGREARWRGSVELVVARGFGSPAVTAECAVGFLRPGGRLVVSEPPGGDPSRWDPVGLAGLGLDGPEILRGDGATAAACTLPAAADEHWPRRTGVPAHRPLWR